MPHTVQMSSLKSMLQLLCITIGDPCHQVRSGIAQVIVYLSCLLTGLNAAHGLFAVMAMLLDMLDCTRHHLYCQQYSGCACRACTIHMIDQRHV